MAKGKKCCPSCKSECAARSLECKCGHTFVKKGQEKQQPKERRKRRTKEQMANDRDKDARIKKSIEAFKEKYGPKIEDWKSIPVGSRIYISGGGPVVPSKDSAGNPIYENMGYEGKFNVVSVKEDYLLCTGNKTEGIYSYCVVYMGEEKEIESGIMLPHNVHFLKSKEYKGKEIP